jgi:hypothetical protein
LFHPFLKEIIVGKSGLKYKIKQQQRRERRDQKRGVTNGQPKRKAA